MQEIHVRVAKNFMAFQQSIVLLVIGGEEQIMRSPSSVARRRSTKNRPGERADGHTIIALIVIGFLESVEFYEDANFTVYPYINHLWKICSYFMASE